MQNKGLRRENAGGLSRKTRIYDAKVEPNNFHTRKAIMLMLTYQCNLDCVYCYEKGKRSNKSMSAATANEIIKKAFAENEAVCEEIEINFMGGEPKTRIKNSEK